MLGSVRSTLLAYLALALAISAVQASSEFQHVQRNHVNLNRFIKKRSPQILGDGGNGGGRGPPLGAGNDPDQITPTPAPSTDTDTAVTNAPTSSPATSDSSSGSSSSSASTSSSDGAGLLGGLFSGGGLLGSSSSSSSSLSSSAATSSTSAPVSSPPTSTSASYKPTVTVIATQNQDQETAVPKPTGAALVKSTTIMILIIIASSLGGIAILWTVFRKWKLARSSKFNDRLQPIDWQPTDGERDEGVTPRRTPSNASSFHSASAHGHANGGRGGVGGRTSPLQPIPDHDFTPGAVPIGGYADLARGPSPPMGEVNRGATMGREYEYDHGVPLHHQAGPGAYAAYDYQGPRY